MHSSYAKKHTSSVSSKRKSEDIGIFLRAFALGLLVASGSVLARDYDFYSNASYGRGACLIPALECPAEKDQVYALCYDACRSG